MTETAEPRHRSWWGWGHVDQQLDDAAVTGLGGLLAERFGTVPDPPAAPVDPATVPLPTPRVTLPPSLTGLASSDAEDRLRHGHGNAFRDVVRALHGDVPTVPDAVLRPRDAADVERVLDWCATAGVACVPFGGGTSVVGGVTPPPGPTVSLDLERLDRVLDLDEVSGAARIQGGALGPAIEDQLRPDGWTLRHFPQSWEFSTLGGWIVTRAGGHFATGPTHIDDLTESITAVTPTGTWSSRRLPASGAGPSPDRMLLGSEGTLGVVTEAWVRVQRRPTSRAQATLAFPSESAALAGVRALVQDGLRPANCRLLDPVEAALSGAGPVDGTATVLVLAFEAVQAPLEPEVERSMVLLRDHGGEVTDGPTFRRGDATGTAEGGSGAWRSTFLRAPYLRDGLARLGAVVETFETAVTWDRAEDLIATLRETAHRAATEVCGGALVAVRTTHAYVDGIAPYVTVIAPGPTGRYAAGPGADRIARGRAAAAAWDEVKIAVGEALHAAGATATHHHAVGRDHRPVYDRQRPPPFAVALAAARDAVDPRGILNPGVLLDPAPGSVGAASLTAAPARSER
ncbi:FAD-binding oxidoreductase [Nitriliruptor alkaliphilus]|uniref:FAD-binding oxidoreductase n=1 Tax=Nitriliruptor alkaliphilus TaxID=427918 RepID=UPI00069781F9|nr:FAD-binding oxidoreductase [Nitriliruptor alkaliphilus]